jgi:methylamine---glutamate N-methyltransferase subunit A
MCGLAGIVLRAPGDLGSMLVAMGASIAHRGADSTGFALYQIPPEDRLTVSLHAGNRQAPGSEPAIEAALAAAGATDVELEESVTRKDELFARYRFAAGADIGGVAASLDGIPGVSVHGIGRGLTVIKDLGSATQVDTVHRVSGRRGVHGTVHCRLATESRVDVDFSHPFWARPFDGITIVHHGHITNYERLRRTLSQRGYEFRTENDSETLAIYLADRLLQGDDVESALHASVRDCDGTFTYLLATADGVGAARDRWGACPLVVAETEDLIVFGSEERVLLTVVPEGTPIRCVREESVVTWSSTVTS